MKQAVQLRNVRKTYGDVEVIKQVSLSIDEGEFIAFVGPSGSGKSTLLRMVAGLESVTDGEILIDGKDVTFAEPSDRGIAMVFQSYALYPHMNVYDNIAFNLKLSRHSKSEIEKRVNEAARILRLEELLQRSPGQLSGGQRQRVAIGRAIVRNPRVFLFDEPLSNLDAALRVQMRLEIGRLHAELGATMIYVTHDQVEAMTLADRIVVLNNCEIQQIGKPMELYQRPRNKFVASFIGSPNMNFFPAQVSRSDATSSTLKLADATLDAALANRAMGESITLGVRPEAVVVLADRSDAAGGVVIEGKVVGVERLGNVNYAYFDVGQSEPVTAQIAGTTDLGVGDTALLGIDPARCHYFDGAGEALRVGN
ncbi:hypothetical protein WH87_17770 [Devosia epidermidihirudinis]|uniref:ABC transporter domain-containing protein n=1 Tax=Devosia epidermidihirudinis TaxID=1293439 RepID=A0A0F5Q2M9_9HYPH|nr:sn-glycerol-3-phosphate ABC transporter ATP-binding protein UgpC [Devosia epidermidihirudinis]KKC35157.1 hypothetical protein WH87_17770 [Devosia epidermidihirudinis]